MLEILLRNVRNTKNNPSTFRTFPFSGQPWAFCSIRIRYHRKASYCEGRKWFFLLAMDYFTNWVEAKAYSNVTSNDVINFIWKYTICRFGLLKSLIMDNGMQFSNLKIEGFCEMYGITMNYLPVYHP